MKNTEFRILTTPYKIFVLGVFSLVCSFSFGQKTVPELWGQRVHDEAHVLQQGTVDRLEKNLKSFEDSTSNQIAILIIQSLDGDVLENFSIRTVEKWGLGQKGKDNGVLLLIAVDDHKIRIEVGRGLQGVLTDAQCSRIIRNDIAAAFRRGDYDAGVTAGITNIIKTIGGEYEAEKAQSDFVWIIVAIVAGLFFIIILIVAFVKEFRSKENSSERKPMKELMNSKYKKGGAMFIPGFTKSSRKSSSSLGSGLSLGKFTGGGGSFDGGGSSGSW